MPTLLFILMVGGALLLFCLLSRRSEVAVYGYLAVWLFFPKFIRMLPLLGGLPWEGVSVFEVLEAVVVCVLFVVCLLHPPRRAFDFGRRFGGLLWGFLIMTAGTYCYVEFVSGEVLFAQPGFAFRFFAYPALQMIYACIFGWACLRYLDTFRKIEPIFLLLALSAVELTCEVVFLYYGKLVPFLEPWLLDSNNTGRFNSLAFLSFDTVGLMSILNVVCFGYLALAWRRPRLLVTLPLLLLPIVATLAKAPLSGALLALTIFFSLTVRRHRTTILASALLFLLSTLVVEASRFANLSNLINGAFGGAVREDIDVGSTFFGRTGLWLRGADIFLQHFPFGVGNGMVEYGMSAAGERRLQQFVSGLVEEAYSVVAAKEHVTNIHNAFLEFLVENGVMGVLVMTASLLMLGSNFVRFVRARRDESSPLKLKIFYAQVALYSAIGGMAWRYFFEAGDKAYFLFFLLLYLTSALPVLAREDGAQAGPAGRRTRPERRRVRRHAPSGWPVLAPR
ncbi:MAG: O-antigen ligase family protein [Verrucomicrobia bacterium]|nr:O-antigen ligase family protein [Verrucomicrobiota bacterium]